MARPWLRAHRDRDQCRLRLPPSIFLMRLNVGKRAEEPADLHASSHPGHV
jgi:hypothetical protein